MSDKVRPCRYCGREVSRNARTCPACGGARPYPLKRHEKVIAGVAVAAVLGVLGLWLASPSADPGSTLERLATVALPPSGLPWTGTTGVAMKYAENPIAADSEFKDKLLLIRGSVLDIERRSANEAEVVLGQSGQTGTSKPDSYAFQVRCRFARDQAEKLARLRIDEAAEFVGICRGQQGGQVKVTDCVLATAWSRSQRVGLGVSVDDVMRAVPGYSRAMYGYDQTRGDMQAIYCPTADTDPRNESVLFVGALDDPHSVLITNAEVAGRLTSTTSQVLAGALRDDAAIVREWLDGAVASLERRDKNSVERAFGQRIVHVQYDGDFDLSDVLATDAEAKERLRLHRAVPENQRLRITISSPPADGIGASSGGRRDG